MRGGGEWNTLVSSKIMLRLFLQEIRWLFFHKISEKMSENVEHLIRLASEILQWLNLEEYSKFIHITCE